VLVRKMLVSPSTVVHADVVVKPVGGPASRGANPSPEE